MARGALIGESVLVGAALSPTDMTVTKISRIEAGYEPAGQPRVWTFIEFELPDDNTSEWADALQDALDPRHGWYCDFNTATEKFVVFSGHLFRYPLGDQRGRAEAAAHARSVGVPEHQLDWPEEPATS